MVIYCYPLVGLLHFNQRLYYSDATHIQMRNILAFKALWNFNDSTTDTDDNESNLTTESNNIFLWCFVTIFLMGDIIAKAMSFSFYIVI